MKKQAVSMDYLHSAGGRPVSMIRIRVGAGNSRKTRLTGSDPVAVGRGGGLTANKIKIGEDRHG
jgi:hypothetical protein